MTITSQVLGFSMCTMRWHVCLLKWWISDIVHLFPIIQWLFVALKWTPQISDVIHKALSGLFCSQTPWGTSHPEVLSDSEELQSSSLGPLGVSGEKEGLFPPLPPTGSFLPSLKSQLSCPVSWRPSLVGNPQRWKSMDTHVHYMHPPYYLKVPSVLRVSQLGIKNTFSFIKQMTMCVCAGRKYAWNLGMLCLILLWT